MQGRAWAAKASLSSTNSRSSTDHPARSRAMRVAGTGPIPIRWGSSPATPEATTRKPGSSPRAFAFASLVTRSAAAPSLIPDAFPAVTVEAGQTLSGIADEYLPDLSVAEGVARLQLLNGLSTSHIHVGQVLRIPDL